MQIINLDFSIYNCVLILPLLFFLWSNPVYLNLSQKRKVYFMYSRNLLLLYLHSLFICQNWDQFLNSIKIFFFFNITEYFETYEKQRKFSLKQLIKNEILEKTLLEIWNENLSLPFCWKKHCKNLSNRSQKFHNMIGAAQLTS